MTLQAIICMADGSKRVVVDGVEMASTAADLGAEDWAVVDAATHLAIPLAQAKAEKNAEINAARASANGHTFIHDGREFACDALSRSDIDGINGYVALNGAFPQQFPGVWKAVDNTYYPLPDLVAWKAFYAAMVATGATNFAHAQDLKAVLAAADTLDEVAAISW